MSIALSDVSAPSVKSTDEALLLRIARRERQALEQLYDRYSGWVYGLALQMQPDSTRAEEIVIETFWYMWKYADRLSNSATNFESWLPVLVSGAAARLESKGKEPF